MVGGIRLGKVDLLLISLAPDWDVDELAIYHGFVRVSGNYWLQVALEVLAIHLHRSELLLLDILRALRGALVFLVYGLEAKFKRLLMWINIFTLLLFEHLLELYRKWYDLLVRFTHILIIVRNESGSIAFETATLTLVVLC